MSASRDAEHGAYYVQCWYRDWTGQRKMNKRSIQQQRYSL